MISACCPLCGSSAQRQDRRDFIEVGCAACGQFIVTPAALECLETDPHVKTELMRQTRSLSNGGGRAFLGADTVQLAKLRSTGADDPH